MSEEKSEHEVHKVIPAVCITCANTVLGHTLFIGVKQDADVCSFDESILVSFYDYDEVYENWGETCSKWKLSDRMREDMSDDTSIMYHPCNKPDK